MVESARRARNRQNSAAGPAAWQTGPWPLVAFCLALTLVLVGTLTSQLLPGRYELNTGDVSAYDIKSPAKVTYVSQIRTNQERARAAAAVPDVYRPIADASSKAQALAIAGTAQIDAIRQQPVGDSAKLADFTQLRNVALTQSVATDIISLDDVQWRAVVSETLRITDRNSRLPITPTQIADVKATLPTQVDPTLADREAAVVVALARDFIGPTEEIDPEATQAARQAAANAVQPFQVTIEKGETILRNGDVVDAAALEKLQAVGLRNPTIQWSAVLATALLALALSVLVSAYIYSCQPQIATNPPRLLLLGILLVAPLIAAKLTIPGRELYAYLFPVAAAPMLLSILLGADTSLIATAAQAVVFGLVTNSGLEIVLAVLVAGGLGALVVRRMERVSVLTTAAAMVAVADFAIILSFQLAAGTLDVQQIPLYVFLALVAGALSAALTLGTVSFLGNTFGIATTLNLLELAHPSQPLFRRLLTEAPGTYHHSVLVANLAERATAAIGGDSLLSRIGGYYHDIGKLTRPYVFIENQSDGQNVHEELDAYTSARLILAHVPDGIDLAMRNGLPTRVQDLIAQHHGTMVVQYFLWQAKQGTDQPVDEKAFQYDGPRPQSREAAIMMMADGIEAAVRASRDHSAERVAEIVDKIIQERVAAGQLDECDLTLADLRTIRAAFLSVLQGIFHPRIQYPTDQFREARVAGGQR